MLKCRSALARIEPGAPWTVGEQQSIEKKAKPSYSKLVTHYILFKWGDIATHSIFPVRKMSYWRWTRDIHSRAMLSCYRAHMWWTVYHTLHGQHFTGFVWWRWCICYCHLLRMLWVCFSSGSPMLECWSALEKIEPGASWTVAERHSVEQKDEPVTLSYILFMGDDIATDVKTQEITSFVKPCDI